VIHEKVTTRHPIGIGKKLERVPLFSRKEAAEVNGSKGVEKNFS